MKDIERKLAWHPVDALKRAARVYFARHGDAGKDYQIIEEAIEFYCEHGPRIKIKKPG